MRAPGRFQTVRFRRRTYRIGGFCSFGADVFYRLGRLRRRTSEYEAILLNNNLSENGIPAWVTGGEGVRIFGDGLAAAGLVGVDVRIRTIDLEAARLVLAELQKDSSSPSPLSWKCECGEEVDEGFAVCWSCGSEWGSQNDD